MSADPEVVETLAFQDSGRSFFGVLAAAIAEKQELERGAASVATSAKGANEFTFGSQVRTNAVARISCSITIVAKCTFCVLLDQRFILFLPVLQDEFDRCENCVPASNCIYLGLSA